MKTLSITPQLSDYLDSHVPLLHPALDELRAVTSQLPGRGMQITRDQGAFMHLLAKTLGASRVVEVGCFTGYSTICAALGMVSGGKLITIDVDPENTAIAQKFFHKTGTAEKIELRIGPALEHLPKIEKEWGSSSVDMMFIDGDKENMVTYYDWAIRLLRPGGIVICDNVLWGGRVVDDEDQSSATVAIRKLNEHVARDERADRVMLPISDGLFLARKK